MKALSVFNRAANRLLERGVIVVFGAMTTIIFAQVIFRYALETSLSWSEELARYLFVWLTFMGASVALRDESHIKVTMVMDLVSKGRVRKILRLLANILAVVFLYLLMSNGIAVAMRVLALDQVSPTMEFLPIGLVYTAIPIGCFFMILTSLEQAYRLCLDVINDR